MLVDWVYLYVFGLWINSVDCGVCMKLWSFGVFCENECDDENLVIWCYKLMFWFILKFLLCMLLLVKFTQQFWVNGNQNWGFWKKIVWVSERNPKIWVPCSVKLARRACLRRGEMFRTKPIVFDVSGSWGHFRTSPSVSFYISKYFFNS